MAAARLGGGGSAAPSPLARYGLCCCSCCVLPPPPLTAAQLIDRAGRTAQWAGGRDTTADSEFVVTPVSLPPPPAEAKLAPGWDASGATAAGGVGMHAGGGPAPRNSLPVMRIPEAHVTAPAAAATAPAADRNSLPVMRMPEAPVTVPAAAAPAADSSGTAGAGTAAMPHSGTLPARVSGAEVGADAAAAAQVTAAASSVEVAPGNRGEGGDLPPPPPPSPPRTSAAGEAALLPPPRLHLRLPSPHPHPEVQEAAPEAAALFASQPPLTEEVAPELVIPTLQPPPVEVAAPASALPDCEPPKTQEAACPVAPPDDVGSTLRGIQPAEALAASDLVAHTAHSRAPPLQAPLSAPSPHSPANPAASRSSPLTPSALPVLRQRLLSQPLAAADPMPSAAQPASPSPSAFDAEARAATDFPSGRSDAHTVDATDPPSDSHAVDEPRTAGLSPGFASQPRSRRLRGLAAGAAAGI